MHKRLVLLFAVLALAGCVEDDAQPTTAAPEPAADTLAAQVLAAAPEMAYDADEAIAWWEHISTAYPKHDSWTPANDDLRDHLVSELEAIGMEVEVRSYQALPRDPAEPPVATPVTEIDTIVATKTGTGQTGDGPEHRIGLVSHYDTQAATVHGAYDDKSGVAAQFHICKALAQVPMNKTLACIFFDAEEQGLVASARYVEDIQDETDDYVYDQVLGYDMTGINWPGHDWKMYMMTGPADHVPWLVALGQEVMHRILEYPVSYTHLTLPTKRIV